MPVMSILRFDVILDEKSNMAAHLGRSSTAERRSAVNFNWDEKETGFYQLFDGYEDPQSKKHYFMSFQFDHIGQRSS